MTRGRPGPRRAGAVLPLLLALASCAGPGETGPRFARPPGADRDTEYFEPRPVNAAALAEGDRLLEAGAADAALRAYGEALRLAYSADALAGAGAASFRLGRFREAERLLEAAVRLEPGHVRAWNDLGVVRHALGTHVAAREALRTAFALDGGRTDSIRQNLAMVESLVPEPVDLESVVTQFQVVRADEGKYLLVDRTQPTVK